jgi:hypothetical protein
MSSPESRAHRPRRFTTPAYLDPPSAETDSIVVRASRVASVALPASSSVQPKWTTDGGTDANRRALRILNRLGFDAYLAFLEGGIYAEEI